MGKIVVKRLRTKAVFKIILLGMILISVPLFTLLGILASFGLVTMYWGSQALTGSSAIIAGPFIGLFMALILGLVTSVLSSLGLMLYAKMRPITIEYYPLKGAEENVDSSE